MGGGASVHFLCKQQQQRCGIKAGGKLLHAATDDDKIPPLPTLHPPREQFVIAVVLHPVVVTFFVQVLEVIIGTFFPSVFMCTPAYQRCTVRAKIALGNAPSRSVVFGFQIARRRRLDHIPQKYLGLLCLHTALNSN